MKVLLIGEYSNVHATLADGLRTLSHEVTVLSNGDFWKNYPRDIDLVRHTGFLGGCRYAARLVSLLPRLRGYDVVQLINPMFLELKAKRLFPVYNYLRRYNGKMILGAFGMDFYWVHTCDTEMPLRYSDFNMGKELRHTPDAEKERRDWKGTPKERLNRMIAEDCDAIVSGLYEYHVCYQPHFPGKTRHIPYPIRQKYLQATALPADGKLNLFIGINRERSVYKGTDIMLRAAQDVVARHEDKARLMVAESVPFDEYQKMMEGSDVILDQLYSYTPSMNALEAMSRGIVCVGGGEPEHYELLGEEELRPVVNVQPTYESVRHELEQLILHPQRVGELKRQGLEYIRRYHDYLKVAREYEELYKL